jgi:prepilin-type N-terminal cleavage/methylation domain-containing protein
VHAHPVARKHNGEARAGVDYVARSWFHVAERTPWAVPVDAQAQPTARRRCSLRFGFTLVELLVVIGIVGLLTAIVLPAIQASREASRRAVCKSNLRQIGVALIAYHTAHRHFPIGCVEWRSSANPQARQLAWSAYLLPFVEETSLYDSLDLGQPFDSPRNAAAAAMVLPLYFCPSSQRSSPLVKGRGACDYGGIYGERITTPNNPPKGTMLIDTPVTMRQISDGASKTLIVAEDSRFSDGQWINGRNIFDQAYPINAAPPFENDIRSEHTGGAQGVMVDGSVHFFAETMDLKTLAALCTRSGGETVGNFE